MTTKKNKTLFLDYDGVLAWVNETQGRTAIDPIALECLHHVIEETSCKIVVSSMWRFYFDLSELAAYIKVPKSTVIDMTPKMFQSIGRGAEIDLWMQEHGHKVSHWAIVDDDDDMLDHQLTRFVHVSKFPDNSGLNDAAAKKLIQLLNHGPERDYPEGWEY